MVMKDGYYGSSAQGEVFVSNGQLYYVKPDINADKIFDISQNNYIVEQRKRHRALIFTDEPEIHVYNVVTGERDEEIEKILTEMASSKEVNIWVKMIQVWVDRFNWGAAFINPVWEVQGLNSRRVLTQLRRLPPESFAPEGKGLGVADIRNEILRGVVLAKNAETGKQELHLFQTDSTGQTQELDNVVMIQDPADTQIGGTSPLAPMVPVINMINFSWTGQMQKVNRIGAPIMFIKMLEGKSKTERPISVKNSGREIDDIAHAKKILQNWGKNTGHILLDNMGIEIPSFQDSQSAIETIDKLEKRIDAFFSPAKMIQKEGATIGGNAVSELKLIISWIKSEHSIIEVPFTRWLQEYLDCNGYAGYRVEIVIPEPTPDMSEVNRATAESGYNTQSLDIDERRDLLGYEEADDEKKKRIKEEFEMGFGSGFDEAGFQTPVIEDVGRLPEVEVEEEIKEEVVEEIVEEQPEEEVKEKIEEITPDQDVQVSEDLVLNGAQIQAALQIVTAVAEGAMPRDAGIGQLQVLFNLSNEQAEQIMGSAGKPGIPTTPNPKPTTALQQKMMRYKVNWKEFVPADQHQETPGAETFDDKMQKAEAKLEKDLLKALENEPEPKPKKKPKKKIKNKEEIELEVEEDIEKESRLTRLWLYKKLKQKMEKKTDD